MSSGKKAGSWLPIWLVLCVVSIAAGSSYDMGDDDDYPEHSQELVVTGERPRDDGGDLVSLSILDGKSGLPKNDGYIKSFIYLQNMSPLSIVTTMVCPAGTTHDVAPHWTRAYEDHETKEQIYKSSFYRSCVFRGTYQIDIKEEHSDCKTSVGYQLRSMEENIYAYYYYVKAPSKLRIQRQRERHHMLIKWDKVKINFESVEYCVAVSVAGPQKSLCQAIGNSAFTHECCEISIYDYLRKTSLQAELKLTSRNATFISCTGKRNKQMVLGMKPLVTYYVNVFAVHTTFGNITILIGSTQVHFEKPRPIELPESKAVSKKLSLAPEMFSFTMPNRTTNDFFQLLVTPCGGPVHVELLRESQQVKQMFRNVYMPKIITHYGARPGKRYLIRVLKADETAGKTHVQITATAKQHFVGLPGIPKNLTALEVTPMRKCRSVMVAWYAVPEKTATYCLSVFHDTSKGYYNNPNNPTYCDLPELRAYKHPQFYSKSCYPSDSNDIQWQEMTNLMPNRHYLVFLTASIEARHILPYKSLRVRTASELRCAGQDSSEYFDPLSAVIDVISKEP